MWYDARRTGVEIVKVTLSVLVLWGGLLVSSAADHVAATGLHAAAGDEILGIWQWVARPDSRPAKEHDVHGSLLEIHRDENGRLSARVMLDDGIHRPKVRAVRHVSFDQGKLCLTIAAGTGFKGVLDQDGRTIDGKVVLDGRPSTSAELRKVTIPGRPPARLTSVRTT